MKRASVWIAVIALCVGAADARADDVDYGAFKTAFDQMVGGGVDAELGKVQQQLKDSNTPASAVADLRRAESELKLLKKRVGDVKTVEALWGSIKGGKDAIAELGKQFDKQYSTSIHIPTLTVDKMKQSGLSKWSGPAASGADYAVKLYSLSKDVDAISSSGLSPETKRLARSMTVLTSIMSEFGGKVPMIGDFVKAYGDLGAELLKVTAALDGKIQAREGGQMLDGVHGDRKFMLDQLRKKGFDSAQRLRAMRDVFRSKSGTLVIWDPAARDWAEVPGSVDEAELLRRYLHYAKRGIKNPTAVQVVGEFNKILELDLTASKRRIKPGETIELRVSATRAKDGKAVTKGIYVMVSLAGHSGIGAGVFKGAQQVQLGGSVTWTAPDNVNERYRFTVDLADASKKVVSSTGPARAFVYTGGETKLTLSADTSAVGFGGEVVLTARVTDSDGKPLDAKANGRIEISVSPHGGYRGDASSTVAGKGLKQGWTAPDKAGTYTFNATYEGATSYALFGSNTAGSEATTSVKVRAPKYSFAVSPESASVKKGETASFVVTLTNQDPEERVFVIHGTVGPRSQTRHWTVSKQSKNRVSLAGGATEKLSFDLTPTDTDKSKSLRVSLRAAPKGASQGKRVKFSASTGGGEKLRLTITTAASKGKARAGGKSKLSGEFAPGETLELSFKTWGERRKFCAQDVVARNRNNRRVKVHSHGENGCSYGTVDGRLRSSWKVSERVSWSGPGVSSASGSTRATFVVPEKPGRYLVTAKGEASWTLTRKTAGGRVKPSTKKESGNGSFTIEVAALN